MSEKPFTHIMIDLETAGSGPRAAILSIGAIEFDPMDEHWLAPSAIELNVEFADAFKLGVADGDTFAWWLKQSDPARQRLLAQERMPLGDALLALSDYYCRVAGEDGKRNVPVWGNGATFDITILEAAYAACQLNVPWRYNGVRDCRTLKDLAGPGLEMWPRADVPHSAVDDAVYQAEWVARGYRMIKQALAPQPVLA